MAARTGKPQTPSPNGPSRKPTSSRMGGRSVLRRILFWALKWTTITTLWAGILIGGVLVWYAYQLPSLSAISDLERRPSVTLLSRDGEVFATFGHVYGEPVTLEYLPPYLIQAVLATEDRRFYEHHGIDLRGVARAAISNLVQGRVTEGASTITQQLAKNLFLSHERTMQRKLKEVVIALWLEYHLSKDDILTLYLNRVYFGSGTYGVDAAARRYFNKPATRVTVLESAYLAGALKAPSRLNPIVNPTQSRTRALSVIDNMAEAGFLTNREANIIKAAPVTLPTYGTGNGIRFFADWVMDQIPKLVGYIDRDLTVRTTIDLSLQEQAQATLRQVVEANGLSHNVSQGAFIAIDRQGALRAMSGGIQYAFSQFNRATQAQRQPGSAFKPVVALAAIRKGWRPDDMLIDQPVNYDGWKPQNFDHKFRGAVTFDQALAQSLNVPFVKLADQIGIGSVIQVGRALGIKAKLKRELALTLGISELSLMELTTAYATIAADGQAIAPYGIETIEDSRGGMLYERTSGTLGQVIAPADAQLLQQMLENVVRPSGTGHAAQLPWSAWGKTGTSQDFRDAWFIGATRDLTAGVWVGNDDNTPMEGVTGGTLPASIWRKVMLEAFANSAVRSGADSGATLMLTP
jgi:penicillin-binding protein 1A